MSELVLNQEMKMQHALAPHLFQSLEILQMPFSDLQQAIAQELIENPTIESAQEYADSHIELESSARNVECEEFGGEFENFSEPGEEWADYKTVQDGSDAEEKYRYMMDSLSEASSLYNKLLEQLALSGLNEREKGIAEIVIGNIDDDGYLRLDAQELLDRSGFPIEIFNKILGIIHEFEPAGVGARDLRECLLLQLKHTGRENSWEYRMVDRYLDWMARYKYNEIARAMSLSVPRVKELAASIAALDPRPGRRFMEERTDYITSEITVEKKEGEYVVAQNKTFYPNLFLNPQYLRMLKDPNTTKETKRYIREKIARSKHFIQSIDQRISTMYRIAVEIVRIQRDYFEHGVSRLKPLTMKTVADLLEVHETTISRAAAGKYMQTPQGLHSMKYFFKPGIKTAGGTELANESAKMALVKLIREEDRRKPYSDTRLLELLEKKGIKIARRTIAKYRDQLRILPSFLRKQLNANPQVRS